MAERVYVHLGLPKTATTYLQTILWASRPLLREQRVLLPGEERRDHLWASRVVREDPNLAGAPARHRTAWSRLAQELAGWPGAGLVSHEFFAAASAEQAQRMIADLAPAEVHLVVTAREPLGLFTASWQESLKNRHTTPIEEYALEVSPSPNAIWNWRTLDLRLVLQRWAPSLPASHVHVLPLDTRAPREEIWHRFGGLLGLDTEAFDLSGSFPNESMGVVEAEVLRRVNAHLGDFQRAFDRGVYIRTFLADERLVPRRGERFWPPQERIEEQRRRGREWVDFVRAEGYDVRGDLAHLLVPDELEPRREPSSVTEAEVADVAVSLVAQMLGDVRDLRTKAADEVSPSPRGWWRWRSRSGGR
ncbi:hypothetical protein LRP67_08740 [Nocardioides sp. cx-169]|uniref:hypothetical protein n=1 Tax=Nocardioides sp. cx-169 TaxID=2899080 RepID=UPI001E3A8218|nr:hypothetical protein [Nocardioides sp. cx-169]MCD4534165.1 hypothetical protein [Nocardioides sp. cx-169]